MPVRSDLTMLEINFEKRNDTQAVHQQALDADIEIVVTTIKG